jgi:hypothetical protein
LLNIERKWEKNDHYSIIMSAAWHFSDPPEYESSNALSLMGFILQGEIDQTTFKLSFAGQGFSVVDRYRVPYFSDISEEVDLFRVYHAVPHHPVERAVFRDCASFEVVPLDPDITLQNDRACINGTDWDGFNEEERFESNRYYWKQYMIGYKSRYRHAIGKRYDPDNPTKNAFSGCLLGREFREISSTAWATIFPTRAPLVWKFSTDNQAAGQIQFEIKLTQNVVVIPWSRWNRKAKQKSRTYDHCAKILLTVDLTGQMKINDQPYFPILIKNA